MRIPRLAGVDLVRMRAELEGVNVMVNNHQISARLRPSDFGAQPSQPTWLFVFKQIPFVRAGLPAEARLRAKAGGEGRNRTHIAFHKPLEINGLNHHRCPENKGVSAFCQ
jgi:hypothetical protein